LKDVRRLREGAAFVAFDFAAGTEAEGILHEDGTATFGAVVKGRAAAGITLIQGWAKGDKNEAILQDATELGASHVLFFAARRSVAKVEEGKKRDAKEARLRAVAEGAARQSGRVDVPTVGLPEPLAHVLSRVEATHRYLLLPTATERLGDAILEVFRSDEEVRLAFVVGPEGGLDPEEITAAEHAGFVPVTLGPWVLRCETVAAAVLGAVRILSD
jgi:16S rRNA (uracil1498-N3)-methyltransferase